MTPLTARRGLTIRSAAIPELNGAGWLEPLKLEGEEGINTLFEYRLVLQGPGGGGGGGGGALELDRFIGRELTCCIELEGHGRFLPGVPGGSPAQRGAGVREISGLITQTRTLGQAGQRALVELTLRPWLHLATLTTDCKVFQDQSVVDIIETVLGEYPFAADKRLIERYPQRDYTVQYNESDYEFLSRLMQEWGINHHFEHSAGVHRLIWSDHNGAFQAMQPELQAGESAYHRIPYHPQGHKTERESIHGWSVEQRLTSGRYASRDLDYTRPGALLEVQAEGARAGGHANQEVYLWRGDKAAAHGQGAVAGSDHSQPNAGAQQAANQTQAQGEHLARLRMQALRQGGHRARGVGHLRGIVPGCSFHLTEHPQASANTEYLTSTASSAWGTSRGSKTTRAAKTSAGRGSS
jgi:type VI secretion system secreted protein VgrG